MKNAGNVMEQMGEIALAFAFVSSDRKQFKWVNSRGKLQRCYKTWKKAVQLMPDGVNYFTLVTRTKPAKSKSGFTFEIIGVLSCFDNRSDIDEVNTQYWAKSKYLEAEYKHEWTRAFAGLLKNWYDEHAPEDFSTITYNKLLELT